MKAIIIDDENKARQLLTAMLANYCADVEILAVCDDLPNGVKAIKKHQPELVFLDIEMPGHSGLELIDFFEADEINFDIIFTTAYNQYAIDAFKLQAVDYLLKPIMFQHLIDAVNRAKSKQEKNNYTYQLLKHQLSKEGAKKIGIPQMNGIRFLEPAEVIYFKGDRAYTEIYLKDGSQILASRNLKYFEDVLANHLMFFRCHKSYIVNTNYITEYIKSDGGYLVVNKNIQIGVSGEKISTLLEMINA
jgi:two-component system LytT family response regulator